MLPHHLFFRRVPSTVASLPVHQRAFSGEARSKSTVEQSQVGGSCLGLVLVLLLALVLALRLSLGW